MTQESGTGNGQDELEPIKQQAQSIDAEALKKEIEFSLKNAQQVREMIEANLMRERTPPQSFEGDKGDKETAKGKAEQVKNVVIKTIYAIRGNSDKVPISNSLPASAKGISKSIMTNIATQVDPYSVDYVTAPYLHSLFQKASDGRISDLDSLSQAFNEVYPLKYTNPIVFEKVQRALLESAVEQGWSEEEVKEKLKLIDKKGESAEGLELTQDEKEMLRQSQEYFILRGLCTKEGDLDLLNALYLPHKLDSFVGKELQKFMEKLNITNETNLTDEHYLEFSKQFKDRIVGFFSRVYLQYLQSSAPAEPIEKVLQRGTWIDNARALGNNIQRRVQSLQSIKGNNLSKIKWYIDKLEEFDVHIPFDRLSLQEREEGSVGSVRSFARPLAHTEKGDFAEYIKSVATACLHEENFLFTTKNVTAIKYFEVPHNQSFWKNLEGFLGDGLKNADIDNFFQLLDNGLILDASRMDAKLLATELARRNHTHEPMYGQTSSHDNSTQRGREVQKYLKDIYGENVEDWQILRAQIMGTGDNHSITLREYELGAMADAPKLQGADTSFASYGEKDAVVYKVFNMFAHENLRFSSEKLLLGNLLFLAVEGDNLGKIGAWDHNDLHKWAKQHIEALKTGKLPEDVKNKVVLLAEVINPAGVGSIYSRASWRAYYTTEGYLVPPAGGPNLDVLKSWKNIEDLGIEALKAFVNDADTITKSNFFRNKVKDGTEEERAMLQRRAEERKELVRHIYGKYYMSGEEVTPDIEGKINILYRKLESSNDIEKAYKEFFYKAFARGYYKRTPTLFLTVDRTRDTSGRSRAWEEVRLKTSMRSSQDEPKFNQAVKDLCLAETMLRAHITKEMKSALKQVGNDGKRLYEVQRQTRYELTSDYLRASLRTLGYDTERINRVVEVLETTRSWINNTWLEHIDGKGNYLDDFGLKYGEGKFPFAIGVEELERSLLAHRASGQRTIIRATGEIAMIEEKVMGTLGKYLETLQKVALSGNKDFGPILQDIKTVQNAIEAIHGKGRANKLAGYMAGMAISYFKLDTQAKLFFGLGGLDRSNSLAADFAGGRSKMVVRWDSRDIDRFIEYLNIHDIIRNVPYEVTGAEYRDKEVKFSIPLIKRKDKITGESKKIEVGFTLPKEIKIFGKTIPMPWRERVEGHWMTGDKLRKIWGGDGRAVFLDIMTKYLPIALAILAFFWIQKLIKEAFEKKGGSR